MTNLHVWSVWNSNLEEETYGQHLAKWAASNKRVYWGVFHDEEYPVKHRFDLDPYLTELNKQISSGQNTYLFIETIDSLKQYFLGKIADDIKRGADFADWKKNKLVPTYYKATVEQRPDLVIDYWILLSEFCTIPHDIFRKANPLKHVKLNTKQYGKSGRPYPIICDFDAEEELRKYLKITPGQKIDECFTHADGFLTVSLHGREYGLATPRQADIVKTLYEAHKAGDSELHQKEIFRRAGMPDSSRLRDAFQNTEVWNNLIVTGSRSGIYRLNY
jgi:hypothetical protein